MTKRTPAPGRRWTFWGLLAATCALVAATTALPAGASTGGVALPAAVPHADARVVAASALPVTQASLDGLKLVNYYPAANGWSDMWTDWQPDVLRSDLAKAASLGANAVRVITFPYTMGYPTVSATMESRLEQFVGIAHGAGLRVQLTLFDHWHAYTDLAGSRQWTTSVLAPLRGNPDIAFVEVQNEVKVTDPGVIPWVDGQIALIHQVLPDVPVTVSADYELPGLLALKAAMAPVTPDFWDLHYYGMAKLAYDTFLRARQAAAPLPLIVGEAGRSTDLSYTGAASQAEAEDQQREWFMVVEAAASAAGLPPAAPWTLFDFTPTGIPYPGIASKEYKFGLFRTDGTAKPAAQVVARAFAGKLASLQVDGFTPVAGAGGLPSLWLPWYPSGTFGVQPGAGPNGVNAVAFSQTATQPGGVTSLYTTPMQPVTSGQTWSASVQARGIDSTGHNFLCIAWYDANDQWLGNSESPLLAAGTTPWTTLSVQAQPPPGAAGVAVYIDSSGNNGSVLFASPQWSVTPPATAPVTCPAAAAAVGCAPPAPTAAGGTAGTSRHRSPSRHESAHGSRACGHSHTPRKRSSATSRLHPRRSNHHRAKHHRRHPRRGSRSRIQRSCRK